MGTRSRIGYEDTDGQIESIYCHLDGYPAGVGKVLLEHYPLSRVELLVAQGDISILAPNMTKPEGHTFDTPVDGHTVFYRQDRGETDVDAICSANRKAYVEVADGCGAEYIYLLTKNGTWTYRSVSGTRFVPLTKKAIEREQDC